MAFRISPLTSSATRTPRSVGGPDAPTKGTDAMSLDRDTLDQLDEIAALGDDIAELAAAIDALTQALDTSPMRVE